MERFDFFGWGEEEKMFGPNSEEKQRSNVVVSCFVQEKKLALAKWLSNAFEVTYLFGKKQVRPQKPPTPRIFSHPVTQIYPTRAKNEEKKQALQRGGRFLCQMF